MLNKKRFKAQAACERSHRDLLEVLKDINDHAVKVEAGAHDLNHEQVMDLIAAVSRAAIIKATKGNS